MMRGDTIDSIDSILCGEGGHSATPSESVSSVEPTADSHAAEPQSQSASLDQLRQTTESR
jgi:hypothetical protein